MGDELMAKTDTEQPVYEHLKARPHPWRASA
jgi:hypothetical protein